MGLRTQKRRRRENRTDYKARRILLESGVPRIVIRRTNKYFILQVVESVEAQDRVVATITSKELLKHGWNSGGKGSSPVGSEGSQSTPPQVPSEEGKIVDDSASQDGSATPGTCVIGSLKSIPAGYLTGLLFAKKLLGKFGSRRSEVGRKYIVDLGMARAKKGGRVFAVVKGLVDGGLDIPVDERVFPSDKRLMGEHMKIADVVLKCREAIFEKGSNSSSSEKLDSSNRKGSVKPEKLSSAGELATKETDEVIE